MSLRLPPQAHRWAILKGTSNPFAIMEKEVPGVHIPVYAESAGKVFT